MHIIQIALDQWGDSSSRSLAILDKTRDLHIVQVKSSNKTFSKLGKGFQNYKIICRFNQIRR